MSDQDTSRSRHESLTNLVNSIEAAENPEKFLIDLTIERMRQVDAELAEAIRYGAIPRRFDANIIGVLREAPDDRETNERLLAGLFSHSFVLDRQGGDYVYHDNIRDLLLEEWRADDDQRARFDAYNQRLVAFYEEQHEKARELDRDLEEVASIVREANPSRYSQLASTVETRIVQPLLEALYHQTLVSARSGYELFTTYFHEYEDNSRLTVCESLLRATRDYVERLPEDDDERESLLGWLRSYRARLMIQQSQFAESEQRLYNLLDQVENDTSLSDTSLKLWVLGDLGRLFERQSNLRQARETHARTLKLCQETQVDLYNLPVRYMNLASVYWTLGELDRAADVYREAIQSARENNADMEGWARVMLGGVLQDLGQRAGAFNVALEALHLVRTQMSPDRSLYRTVLERFMFLLHHHDPHLLDTLFAERSGSLTALGDSSEAVLYRIQYADLLLESGQLERAQTLVTELHDEVADNDAAIPLDQSLLFTEATLRERQGRLAEATDVYTRIIAETQDDHMGRWDHARALSNRGLVYADRGLWSEAVDDFQAALVQWEEIGHENLVARMQALQADTLRNQGQLTEAQRLLDAARAGLPGDAAPTHLAAFHSVQGAVYRKQGRWSEAHREYQQELDFRRALDDPHSAAEISGRLAATAAAQGRWEEAAWHTDGSGEYWRRLHESGRYRPSRDIERADDKNLSGVQCFFATNRDHRERMDQAKGLFREARGLNPDNVWYRLNLAYAHAALEEWGEATGEVNTILEDGPEWLRTPALYERLAEYGFTQGAELFMGGDYQQAAAVYAETLDRCEERVRPELLTVGWLGAGDSWLLLEKLEEARAAYSAGLNAVGDTEGIPDQATFHGRLACVAAALADLPGALQHCRSSLRLRSQTEQGGSAPDMVKEWFREPGIPFTENRVSLIGSTRQHSTLGEALRILTDEAASDCDQRRALITARLDLSTLPPATHAARIDTAESIPVMMSIILEADDRLFPQGAETPEVIRMLETDIPAMRDGLQADTGVTVPGVRISANTDFSEGLYALMLNEVPMATGHVPLDQKYCPDGAGLQTLGIEEHIVIDPGDELKGMWLPEPLWARVEGAGLPLVDPHQFMLSHLEVLIREHLVTFVGLQEVQSWLVQWQWDADQEERSVLFDVAVTDDAAQRRLVHMLRDLVKEEVPVRDLTSILKAFSDANPRYPETSEVVENIRMALRTELPGNQSGRKLVGLSPGFEEAVSRWVWERDGTRFLALPIEEARELLGAVREHLDGREVRNLTLVVKRSGLRPFVRRLVAVQFPTLPVLAEVELVEERASISSVIEYVSQVSAVDD